LMAQILGNDVRIVQPPGSMHEAKHELRATHINNADDSLLKRSRSADLDDRRAVEGALATEGIHHTILPPDILEPLHPVNRVDSGLTTQSDSSNSGDTLSGKPTALHITTDTSSSPSQQDTPRSHSAGEKGHAHDPMDHELLFLGIGIGSDNDDGSLEPPAFPVMAESPTAAEFNIYDTAYQKEVERIRKAQGHRATVFLTRRVDTKREYLADEHMVNTPSSEEIEGTPQEGWKGVLDTAREKHSPTHEHAHLEKLAAIVAGEAKSDNECRTKSDKGSETGGEAGNMLTNVIHKLMDIKRESVGK
jgi:[calcium/calmodulin-dependent protein kinase] kinase